VRSSWSEGFALIAMSRVDSQEELRGVLTSLERRVRVLTVAVLFMALMLLMCTAAVYGSLINYFDGDATMFGATGVGAAVLGFAVGWFARRKA